MIRAGCGRWVVLGMAFLTVVLVACSGSTDVPEPSLPGGPRLSADRRAWDFGEVPIDTPLEAVFHLQNVGNRPLVIQKAITRVEEGCCPTQPQLEATVVPPGETTTLTLRFTMSKGMGGPHLFAVMVSSNDPVEPEATFTVRANFLEE